MLTEEGQEEQENLRAQEATAQSSDHQDVDEDEDLSAGLLLPKQKPSSQPRPHSKNVKFFSPTNLTRMLTFV